jgi:2,4-dienoyl-CoA reductase (NADPH2)
VSLSPQTKDTAEQFANVYTPYDFGFLSLPNRIVMGSMHTGLEEHPDGPQRLARFYSLRASTGLIVTGGVAPNDEGRVGEGSGVLSSQAQLEHHSIVTTAVRAEGGRIILQILHTGRYGYHKKCVAPSALQAPINRYKPREMDVEDIQRTVDDFVNCAKLAQQAGYHGVEIMASEGYLLNQFIAPRTNKRTDAYGGIFENRVRFPLDVLRSVRSAVGPHFLIVFRLSLLDLVEDGSTWDEVVALAKEVEKNGANIINSGIGWHESRVPTIASNVPPGSYAFITGRLRKEIKIPLIAVNRINTLSIAEEILSSQHADFVSMARPLLADPSLAKKGRSKQTHLINTCIGCNQACLDHIFENKIASCLVNPLACHETEWNLEARLFAKEQKNSVSKNVAVVGAGPAGLASAEMAAKLGHKVTVFEASDMIGGQFQLACRVPGKEDYAQSIRYFNCSLEALGVEVQTSKKADWDLLKSYDHVIVATGVIPRFPNLPGVHLPLVKTYADILSGRANAGRRVAILGAGGIGFDVAEFLCDPHAADWDPASQSLSGTWGSRDQQDLVLARKKYLEDWGVDSAYANRGGLVAKPLAWSKPREITLLQRKPGKPGESLGKTTGWIHKASMKFAGVEMLSGVVYEGITEQGLRIVHQEGQRLLEVDTIVLCTGQESENKLYEALKAKGMSCSLVGGAKMASELDAKRAISEGMLAAIEI